MFTELCAYTGFPHLFILKCKDVFDEENREYVVFYSHFFVTQENGVNIILKTDANGTDILWICMEFLEVFEFWENLKYGYYK